MPVHRRKLLEDENNTQKRVATYVALEQEESAHNRLFCNAACRAPGEGRGGTDTLHAR